MANIYVYSAAAGAGTGADWANAYTTLKAAAEAAGTAAGDSLWVANDHAETGAITVTITSKNTAAAPGTIACVSRTGSVPPVAADLATTATVTTTGATNLTMAGAGGTYIYGITFSAGSGANTANLIVTGVIYLKNCILAKPATTASANAFALGVNGGGLQEAVTLDNTSFTCGNVGDRIRACQSNSTKWINTPVPFTGGTIPSTAAGVFVSGGIQAYMTCIGVDFSQLAAATAIYAISGAQPDECYLFNCKLTAASVVFPTPINHGGGTGYLINCDSGATNYRTEKYRYEGTQSIETTIVRTGGATDGTTPISWKIVTTANSKWTFPYVTLPIAIWSNASGGKTVSIYGYWSNASVPNNDDIWIEVGYLGSAASPLGSVATSGKASFLATNAAIPIDTTSVWGGGATTTRFKMSATLTTAMKGQLYVAVRAAATSKTFYIDPKIEIV